MVSGLNPRCAIVWPMLVCCWVSSAITLLLLARAGCEAAGSDGAAGCAAVAVGAGCCVEGGGALAGWADCVPWALGDCVVCVAGAGACSAGGALRRLRCGCGCRTGRLLCIRQRRRIAGLPLARIGRALRGLALLCSLLGVLRIRIDRAHVLFRLGLTRGVLLPGRILDPLDVRTCLRDRAGNQHTDGGGAEKKIRPHLWPPLACPPAFSESARTTRCQDSRSGNAHKATGSLSRGNPEHRRVKEFRIGEAAGQLPLRSWITGKL